MLIMNFYVHINQSCVLRIGLEVAEALRKLDMQVTIVEKKDRMLPLLDGINTYFKAILIHVA